MQSFFSRLIRAMKGNASAATIVTGSAVYVVLISFLRGVLIARILGPQEFGLAVVLITISAGLDLLSDGAVDQYVVRSRFGHRPDVLAVAQGWRLATTLIISLLLVVLSGPIAHGVGTPELTLAIAILALPTLFRGLSTLEIKTQQRERRYDQEAKVDILRTTIEIVTLLATALTFRSHWAVVAGLTANAATQFIASAVLCGRLPKVSFRARPRRLIARFSIPVTLNSLILFTAVQGDRLIIANVFNPTTLALYAAACAIGQAITALLSRIVGRLFLPFFGATTIGSPHKQRQADMLTFLFIAGSFAVALMLVLVVPPVVPLIYGSAFGDVHKIVAASAALQMLQIEQAWLTTLMVGAGATSRFPMITGARAAALPLVLPLLWNVGNILLVPVALTVGATASLAISYATLTRFNVLSKNTALIGMVRAIATIVAVAMLLF